MRVITFSRAFPSYHPRKGEPTHFVEKMIRGYLLQDTLFTLNSSMLDLGYLNKIEGMAPIEPFKPKYHTIRIGQRWKAGHLFSPRVWSGKPYGSKQLDFLPPIKVSHVYKIEILPTYEIFIDGKFWCSFASERINELATNDGLEEVDFKCWFNGIYPPKCKTFTGQIICWNPNIKY